MFQGVSWGMLFFVALVLGLAPFTPEPHVVEKLRMLSEGTLDKGVDIFDLLFHLAPLAFIAVKAYYEFTGKSGGNPPTSCGG